MRNLQNYSSFQYHSRHGIWQSSPSFWKMRQLPNAKMIYRMAIWHGIDGPVDQLQVYCKFL